MFTEIPAIAPTVVAGSYTLFKSGTGQFRPDLIEEGSVGAAIGEFPQFDLLPGQNNQERRARPREIPITTRSHISRPNNDVLNVWSA
jgi:hypothetical protein